MSNCRIRAWDSQSQPTLPEENQPSCFQLIRPIVHSPHEEAVINAGYPWVQTNSLNPTWTSLGADPRERPVPNRLNWHRHHGNNTHLIVEGDLTLDLTLEKLSSPFYQNDADRVTLSMDPGAAKELPIGPNKVYSGTTQQGCKFVEGHRCLSPRSAHRVIIARSLFLHHLEFTFRSVQQLSACMNGSPP